MCTCSQPWWSQVGAKPPHQRSQPRPSPATRVGTLSVSSRSSWGAWLRAIEIARKHPTIKWHNFPTEAAQHLHFSRVVVAQCASCDVGSTARQATIECVHTCLVTLNRNHASIHDFRGHLRKTRCAHACQTLPQVGRCGLRDYKAAVVADMSEGGVFLQGLTSLLM